MAFVQPSFSPPRCTSEPLPPYAYTPGRFPHPVRDPQGHSFGRPPPSVSPTELADWRTSRVYRVGVDLFNHGYYWEAHEAWEALWNALGRRGVEADFVKGLIKLAAAGVKAREGRAEGVARHARRAEALFRATGGRAAGRLACLRCDGAMTNLSAAAYEIAQQPQSVLNDDAAPVVRVFPFVLVFV